MTTAWSKYVSQFYWRQVNDPGEPAPLSGGVAVYFQRVIVSLNSANFLNSDRIIYELVLLISAAR